ncbi:MAG: hypothetical protein HZB16_22770 [Armatimonadetes bacterium]|nr:hypothetical protein [Armatimonadota bacterium]
MTRHESVSALLRQTVFALLAGLAVGPVVGKVGDVEPVGPPPPPVAGLAKAPSSKPLLHAWQAWLRGIDSRLPLTGQRSTLFRPGRCSQPGAVGGAKQALFYTEESEWFHWLRWDTGSIKVQKLRVPPEQFDDEGTFVWRSTPSGWLMAQARWDRKDLRGCMWRDGLCVPLGVAGPATEPLRQVYTARFRDYTADETGATADVRLKGHVRIYDCVGREVAVARLPQGMRAEPSDQFGGGFLEPVTRLGEKFVVAVSAAGGLTDEAVDADRGDAPADRFGNVTVFTLTPTAPGTVRPAAVKVIPSEPRPVAEVGPPAVLGAETRHGVLLADGAGLAYTWRGRAAMVGEKPAASVRDDGPFDEEIMVQALVVDWRDGVRQLVDWRATYKGKITGTHMEGGEMEPWAEYPTYYLWSPDADGRALETAWPTDREDTGTEESAQLKALAATAERELLYFVDGRLQLANLSAAWAEHGK